MCLLSKNLMKLLYFCTCVFLIYDILEYVYHSACDKKFSVQLDPYLVQRKYILRIWRHHDEPSHNYKMAAKSAIMIHYPRAAACLYREAKEFKKSST